MTGGYDHVIAVTSMFNDWLTSRFG
jgi:hypothetical protein